MLLFDFKETLNKIIDTVVAFATTAGLKILIALVIWFISFRIINYLNRKITKKLSNKKTDKTLTRVITYFVTIALKVLVIVCLLGYLGVETTSISAVIASLGVGIGLATNGALSNFAGGVLLIITRPFKVDDYISALGYDGTVVDIHIIYTKIVTPDNKVIHLPNGSLSSAQIVNYSEMKERRVDLVFSVSYDTSFDVAKKAIEEVINANEKVLKDKPITIRMSKHNTSSIDISTKVWSLNSDYWDVYFDLTESVKAKFDAENIEIPYNKLDVYVKKE